MARRRRAGGWSAAAGLTPYLLTPIPHLSPTPSLHFTHMARRRRTGSRRVAAGVRRAGTPAQGPWPPAPSHPAYVTTKSARAVTERRLKRLIKPSATMRPPPRPPSRTPPTPLTPTCMLPLVSRHRMMGPSSAAGRISSRSVRRAGWSSSQPCKVVGGWVGEEVWESVNRSRQRGKSVSGGSWWVG